jgi:probable phosphoglycerate mutase
VAIFSSGHLLRVLASRWVDAPASLGRCLVLGPAGICVLGYEHGGAERVVRLWNDTPRELDREGRACPVE